MLVFLLVLAVAAGAVWARVFSDHDRREAAAAASAASPSCSAPARRITTHLVALRVYNSTDRQSLAANTAKMLRTRGFNVIGAANDPITTRKVTGVGEVRYGTGGTVQAGLVAAAVPGARLLKDDRTSSTVDLALGPNFRSVAPTSTIAAAERALPVVPASGCST